jgi:hypothetical protein
MRSRRSFLQTATFGAVACACCAPFLGAGLGAWRVSALTARAEGLPAALREQLQVLEPWQLVTVQAFADRLLAPEALDVGLFVDGFLRGLPADDLRDVLRFIQVLEIGAPLALGRLSAFSRLGPAARDAVIEAVETSAAGPVRAGYQALKALVMMAFYRRDESWPALGYEGPLVPYGTRPAVPGVVPRGGQP